MASNTRTRGASSSRGDVTGRTKAKQTAEVAEQQKKAAAKVALATASAKEASDEVMDLTKRVPTPVEEPEFTELDGEPTEAAAPDETVEAVLAAAKDSPVAAPREVGGVQRQGATTVQNETSKVRARYDLKAVTVGVGTSYDFEEGRKYVIPTNAARHLAERDLVDIL